MPNSWSTSSEPDFVGALGRRTTARDRQGKLLHTELLKIGQLLVYSARQLPFPWEVAGVFLAIVLWQHPTSPATRLCGKVRKRHLKKMAQGSENCVPAPSSLQDAYGETLQMEELGP